MDALFAGLESWQVAQFLRQSRWSYAAINATHIFGIALLVGAIVPLNLRLLGLWSDTPRVALTRVLVPVAATGLVIAVLAGLLLFSVRAEQYAMTGILQIKLTLISIGILSAIILHLSGGYTLESAKNNQLVGHAIVSLICWTGALLCGRLIAFVDSLQPA